MKNLDTILLAATAGSSIILDPLSAYYTRGNLQDGATTHPRLKSGCRLYGKGATLRVIPTATNVSIDGLYCEGSNLVQDLTIEIASQAHIVGRKVNGIWVAGGSNNLVQRCTIIGQSGHNGEDQKESFGINVGGTRNTVRHCVVCDTQGTYCTAIQVAGGVAEFCKVVWPDPTPAGVAWFSYNLGYITGSTIRNCESHGGTNAVRCEAYFPESARSVAENCKFIRTDIGLYVLAQQHASILTPWHSRDISFRNNIVRLNHASPNTIHGFILDHTWAVTSEDPTTINSIKGISIESNDVGYDTASPSRVAHFANIATNCLNSGPDVGIYDVKLLKNTVDPIMTWRNKQNRAKLVQVDQAVSWITI